MRCDGGETFFFSLKVTIGIFLSHHHASDFLDGTPQLGHADELADLVGAQHLLDNPHLIKTQQRSSSQNTAVQQLHISH